MQCSRCKKRLEGKVIRSKKCLHWYHKGCVPEGDNYICPEPGCGAVGESEKATVEIKFGWTEGNGRQPGSGASPCTPENKSTPSVRGLKPRPKKNLFPSSPRPGSSSGTVQIVTPTVNSNRSGAVANEGIPTVRVEVASSAAPPGVRTFATPRKLNGEKREKAQFVCDNCARAHNSRSGKTRCPCRPDRHKCSRCGKGFCRKDLLNKHRCPP